MAENLTKDKIEENIMNYEKIVEGKVLNDNQESERNGHREIGCNNITRKEKSIEDDIDSKNYEK